MSKYFNFDGDGRTTVTRKKTRKSANLVDNLNGGGLDNYFILPDDEEVYLSLLPAGGGLAPISGGADKTALAKAAAAASGGSGVATPAASTPAATAPAVIPSTPIAQAAGSAPPLPTTAQIDKMDCPTMEQTLDSVTANASYYQANRLGVESTQIMQYLTKKIQACNTAAAAAKPPVISVNGSQSITLPQNSVTVDASGTTDPQGQSLSYMWQLISGPSSPTITGGSAAVASFSNLVAGNYIFQVTATNTSGLSASQNVSVVVSSAPAATTSGSTGIIGNEPVTIATTAPVDLDSTSPYSDPGVDSSGGGGSAAPADDTTDTGTVIAGVVIPVWVQWVAVGLIIAGAVYILSGKEGE